MAQTLEVYDLDEEVMIKVRIKNRVFKKGKDVEYQVYDPVHPTLEFENNYKHTEIYPCPDEYKTGSRMLNARSDSDMKEVNPK